jgi:hypothetical protein
MVVYPSLVVFGLSTKPPTMTRLFAELFGHYPRFLKRNQTINLLLHPMKIITRLVLLISLSLPMQAMLMQVTGTFNGAPTSGGVTHELSGSFTAYFDSNLVAAFGNTTLDNLTLTTLNLSNPLIGSTIFDLTNTYLDLVFVNGSLRSFTLGDVTNNMLAQGIDDFSMFYESGPGLILSQLGVTTQAGFFGVDFRFNDPTTGSFSVSAAPPVPDSAPSVLLMTLGAMGLLSFRRLFGCRFQSGV